MEYKLTGIQNKGKESVFGDWMSENELHLLYDIKSKKRNREKVPGTACCCGLYANVSQFC